MNTKKNKDKSEKIKKRIGEVSSWAKKNPVKASTIVVLSLASLKVNAIRKVAIWSVSYAGTAIIDKLLEED